MTDISGLNINMLYCVYTDICGVSRTQAYRGSMNIASVIERGLKIPVSHWKRPPNSFSFSEVLFFPDLSTLTCIDNTDRIFAVITRSQENYNSKREDLIKAEKVNQHLVMGIELEFNLKKKDCGRHYVVKESKSEIIAELCTAINNSSFRYVIKEERGIDQFEINIGPASPLVIADNFILCKLFLIHFSVTRSMELSFMPYPGRDFECNSAHIHFSSKNFGQSIAEDCASRDLFVSRFLPIMREICVFSNPTVNSFKRLLKRRLDLRVPSDIPRFVMDRSEGWLRAREGKTLEFRLPDPLMDVYPLIYIISHIAMSALEGINNFPGCEALGLPRTLDSALSISLNSIFLNGLIGEQLLRDMLVSKTAELRAYELQLSEWEQSLYQTRL